jgi:hypothetical protein
MAAIKQVINDAVERGLDIINYSYYLSIQYSRKTTNTGNY